MPRHRITETFAAALAAVALVVAPVTAASAADEPVASDDFTSDLSADWRASGTPTLGYVEVEGDRALEVSGRTQTFFGIETVPGLLQAGSTYTITADVRLADGVVTTPQARFVQNPGPVQEYQWVDGTNTAISATGWTTITGTFSVGEGVANARIYLEVSDLSTYLVDDLVLTRAVADPEVTELSNYTFADGLPGSWDWRQSGGAAPGSSAEFLSIVDVEGDPALQVADRNENFDGIETIPGRLVSGETYAVSMDVRLAPGVTGARAFRIVTVPGFGSVPGTDQSVTADAWTTLEGTFTAADVAAGGELKLYIGSEGLAGAAETYTYLVDDIVLSRIGAGGGDPITPSPDIAPGGYPNPTTTEVATAQGTGNVAAFTFDDGPAPDTAALLDFLAEEDIPAVFCVIGSQIEQPGGAELLRRIVAEGHVLCNHSTGFADMGGYTIEQAQADLEQNLRIIRTALGDDDAPVPFFRAPNGSWGQTREVAVALGMQPLAVTNTIQDWDGNDLSVATLEANIRAALQPGRILLAHDGPANRANTVTAISTVVRERLAEGWTFTLPTGTPTPVGPGTPGEVVLSTSFEDGLDGWVPRADAAGPATVAVSTAQAYDGVQSALISGRVSQGQGIGFDVTGVLQPLTTYEVSAWVRFETAQPTDSIVLSVASTTGGATSYTNLVTAAEQSNSGWRELSGSFTIPAADSSLLYVETAYAGGAAGNTSSFYIDDIEIRQAAELVIQDDLTPIKSTVDFPVGVAIDARETAGAQAELLNLHFEQVSAENSMKPEAFYNGAREFIAPADATAVMDFAVENDLRVWGHTLVWHAQTPEWFFENASGQKLTASETDRQILRDRMREHIFSVAELYADEYGQYGGGNPIVAFDVVNEVVTDESGFADGLRRSDWYDILGEEFIDLAFRYADEAFNDVYAADGADRPVSLFINDYNTELTPKGTRMLALLERLLDRGVPVDGVGHQMHVSLSFPVDDLGATLERFEPLGLKQAVTELDVTTGTPESSARFIDQGYFYRDAFRDFRAFDDRTGQLFSVTVWGLSDNRSWRSGLGGPLLFDDALQAKPAYFGVVDDELDAPERSANVFGATMTGVDDGQWQRMPDIRIAADSSFQLRWADDELFVLVEVDDATAQAGDAVELQLGTTTVTVDRDDAQRDSGSSWATMVTLPLGGAGEGDLVSFDVRVLDDGDLRAGWNSAGVLGSLTLLEPLSFVEVVETATAPTIDGAIDAAWEAAQVIETDKQVAGTDGATATTRTLWRDDRLYVLMEVTDSTFDVSGSDPWTKDSVEIYVDPGNVKNGPFRYDDSQIRISATNDVTVGGIDEGFVRAGVVSQTALTATGYIVEASISLRSASGLSTTHGLDFQVNDGSGGNRVSIRNWADPSGQGYLSTARWGVGQLVAAPDAAPQLVLEPGSPRAGQSIDFSLEGLEPGAQVELVLEPDTGDAQAVRGVVVMPAAGLTAAAIEFPLSLGVFTADGDGRVSGVVTIPSTVPPGDYRIVALVDGEPVASAEVGVLAALPDGRLAATGFSADLLTLLLIAALLLAGGLVVVRRSGRQGIAGRAT